MADALHLKDVLDHSPISTATLVEATVDTGITKPNSKLNIVNVVNAGSNATNLKVASNSLNDHLTIKPAGSTIINQKRHTIYFYGGDEALYATATTYLVEVENQQLMSWSNDSDSDQSYTQSYTIGFRSTTSVEVSAKIELAPSIKGVSIGGAEFGVTVLNSEETSKESTHSTTITVGANSDLYFYQRKYKLRTVVYFTLDAWCDLWIAGCNNGHTGNYHVQYATIESTISAREYITRKEALKGSTTLTFQGQEEEDWYGNWTRQFQNFTTLAKSTLRPLGINGSKH